MVQQLAGDAEEIGDQGTAQGIAGERALLADGHEVPRAQGGQMLRDHRLPELERFLQFDDGAFTFAEQLEDPDADGMGERAKQIGLDGLQFRSHKHMNIYIYMFLVSSARRRKLGSRRTPPPAMTDRFSLDPALVVRAYREGIFPMAMESGEIGWFSPDPRGVIPLDSFHIPTRLARAVRSGRFDIHVDRAFEDVMRACAEREDDDGTWISESIIECYVTLHRLGIAHSVETWRGDELVGGLYGVHLGGAFFGESMFHRATDASKVALVALVDRLRRRNFRLLDIQWVTPHLEQFGAIEIPQEEYLGLLRKALKKDSVLVVLSSGSKVQRPSLSPVSVQSPRKSGVRPTVQGLQDATLDIRELRTDCGLEAKLSRLKGGLDSPHGRTLASGSWTRD